MMLRLASRELRCTISFALSLPVLSPVEGSKGTARADRFALSLSKSLPRTRYGGSATATRGCWVLQEEQD